MVGLKNGHIRKNFIQNGEFRSYSWGTQKKKKNDNKEGNDSINEVVGHLHINNSEIRMTTKAIIP